MLLPARDRLWLHCFSEIEQEHLMFIRRTTETLDMCDIVENETSLVFGCKWCYLCTESSTTHMYLLCR